MTSVLTVSLWGSPGTSAGRRTDGEVTLGRRGLWFAGLAGGPVHTGGTGSSQVNGNQPRQAAAALWLSALFNLEEPRRAASL